MFRRISILHWSQKVAAWFENAVCRCCDRVMAIAFACSSGRWARGGSGNRWRKGSVYEWQTLHDSGVYLL
jgi:hypothetical protein